MGTDCSQSDSDSMYFVSFPPYLCKRDTKNKPIPWTALKFYWVLNPPRQSSPIISKFGENGRAARSKQLKENRGEELCDASDSRQRRQSTSAVPLRRREAQELQITLFICLGAKHLHYSWLPQMPLIQEEKHLNFYKSST